MAVNTTTLLYVLSTTAQTCAALAALIGALGLYRLQSIRSRQEQVERLVRGMVGGVRGSVEWANALPLHELIDREAVEFARGNTEKEAAGAERMQGYLGEWRRFDPDYRRTSRLLGVFVLWNLIVIGVSFVGFLFVHQLAPRPWLFTTLVWTVALGTVFASIVMLMEMRNSLVRRSGRIAWLIQWLEHGP